MKIAVIFPGIGYHCDKPLLYYGRKVANECGYEEVINLNYSYDGGNIRGNKEKMEAAFKALYAQAIEALSGIDFSKYDDILFISKSVGTIIASAYANEYGIDCRQVLYTPLEHTFSFKHSSAIAFIGSADPWSDVDEVVKLSTSQGVPISLYKELNHSLEGYDVEHNIVILCDVMKKTKDFILNNK